MAEGGSKLGNFIKGALKVGIVVAGTVIVAKGIKKLIKAASERS